MVDKYGNNKEFVGAGCCEGYEMAVLGLALFNEQPTSTHGWEKHASFGYLLGGVRPWHSLSIPTSRRSTPNAT